MIIFLAIIFVASFMLLMKMAKEDLLLRKVILKSFKYKKNYAAKDFRYSKIHKRYK